MLNKIIRYFLENKLVTMLILAALIGWGLATAPFGWQLGLPTSPVPVDAIPDIGENQQIVFADWPGRSPQDIEDQITYPLTTSLLGIPGVKTVRSTSMFGFSSIYIIFNDDVEFYWSRSRILEKLNSLPAGLLPEGVQPALGPDATALGQVFWYTLEGRDAQGNPTGGWDLHEIRRVQDFYVKYGLNAVEGVSEVASIGGYVQEYQVDVNPDALRAYRIPLDMVMMAVKNANRDIGAKTIEINQAEYLVRGLGYIKSISDLEQAVVSVSNNVPVRIKDVAVVTLGPAERRGMLDKEGAEVAGGVVVARYGANPMQVIEEVKRKIAEISPGLPKKTLADGTESQLAIVPFYDRTQLINETLGTLEEDLKLETIITVIVIVLAIGHLRAALVISSLLPIGILISFILMRYFGISANIVSLAGVAIAIGEMIDLGIVLVENILKHEEQSPPEKPKLEVVYEGAAEVGSALLTAVLTTIVSFTPVFLLESAEGKLFGPLAYTKTFAMVSSALLALFVLPSLFHLFLGMKIGKKHYRYALNWALFVGGIALLFMGSWAYAVLAMVAGGVQMYAEYTGNTSKWITQAPNGFLIALVAWVFSQEWMPLGVQRGPFTNFLFTAICLVSILGGIYLFQRNYGRILGICLAYKRTYLTIPAICIAIGLMVWQGFAFTFGWMAWGFEQVGVNVRTNGVWSYMHHAFPGIGQEFMPSLDEGSFLLMPTSMPHAGVEQNKLVVQQLDMLLGNIPEVELAVGKMGRAESALDPAPISMYENVINYLPEYAVDTHGKRLRFQTDEEGNYLMQPLEAGKPQWKLHAEKAWIFDGSDTISAQTAEGIALLASARTRLIPHPEGQYFRQWRPEIQSPDDIWKEIVRVTKIPGVTSAPKLQPIETRLVMLQTGMRAPMGIKVYGPDLATIEQFGLQLEAILKQVPSVKKEAVFADRIVGKPYLHINIDREAIARYGLSVEALQQNLEVAVGGMQITTTVEGRERFPVRVRYPRELRTDPDALEKVLIPTPTGVQVPLGELATLSYTRGPQMIKSENTFLTGYVLFDKKDGYAEVDVVEAAQQAIQQQIDEGKLQVPAGVSYKFSGSYENQVRAEKKFAIIIPLVLIVIFLILYFEFNDVVLCAFIFSGVAMAFSGAFIFIWLYGQAWFADFSLFGTNMRELFQVQPINLSVAVWVGFISLFGISTDDEVIMTTYLNQQFRESKPTSVAEIRARVIAAGEKRIRPALMTIATTIIALLPVLTSSGRGSDVTLPMAIPTYGGMLLGIVTINIVPVLYCWREERRLLKTNSHQEGM